MNGTQWWAYLNACFSMSGQPGEEVIRQHCSREFENDVSYDNEDCEGMLDWSRDQDQ